MAASSTDFIVREFFFLMYFFFFFFLRIGILVEELIWNNIGTFALLTVSCMHETLMCEA